MRVCTAHTCTCAGVTSHRVSSEKSCGDFQWKVKKAVLTWIPVLLSQCNFVFVCLFVCLFWLHLWQVEVPNPGTEPMPLQGQHQILNLLCHNFPVQIWQCKLNRLRALHSGLGIVLLWQVPHIHWHICWHFHWHIRYPGDGRKVVACRASRAWLFWQFFAQRAWGEGSTSFACVGLRATLQQKWQRLLGPWLETGPMGNRLVWVSLGVCFSFGWVWIHHCAFSRMQF